MKRLSDWEKARNWCKSRMALFCKCPAWVVDGHGSCSLDCPAGWNVKSFKAIVRAFDKDKRGKAFALMTVDVDDLELLIGHMRQLAGEVDAKTVG